MTHENEKASLLGSKKIKSYGGEHQVVFVDIEDFTEFDSNNCLISTSLTYEELVPFLIDPSWIRVRKICFSMFWISFLVILMTSCIISYDAAKRSTCGIEVISNGMVVEDISNNSSLLPSVDSSISVVKSLLGDNLTGI